MVKDFLAALAAWNTLVMWACVPTVISVQILPLLIRQWYRHHTTTDTVHRITTIATAHQSAMSSPLNYTATVSMSS